ncbi:MAG: glycosyltransferase 87 family protein [Acidimicrobiales bacterium]
MSPIRSDRLTPSSTLRFTRLAIVAAVIVQFGRLLRVVDYQRIDFRVYYAAVADRSTDLYDFRFRINGLPFTYPPATALVLRPLTSINELLAERLFFTASLVMVLIFALVCVRMLPRRPAAWFAVPLFVIFIVFMMPATLTLRLGQINAVIALLVLLDAVLLDHDSAFAGFGSGFAAALKVTPALAIVVFIATGRRRAAGVSIATYAAVTAFGALWYPSQTAHYWTSVLWQTARVGNVKTGFNQRNPSLTRRGTSCADFSNSIRRVVSWLPENGNFQTGVWLLLAGVIVGIAIVRVRIAFGRGNHLAAMTLISCATYAVSPITWGHHLFFLGPMTLLTAGDGRSRVRVAAAVVAGFLILDPIEHGEGAFFSFGRVILCAAAVLFMPIDERQATYEPRAYAEHNTSRTTLLQTNTARRMFRRALSNSPHTANDGNAANV